MDSFVEVSPEALRHLKDELGAAESGSQVVRVFFQGFG